MDNLILIILFQQINCTCYHETRQLDYYEEKGVTTSNYSLAIKKYNDVANSWALRSAPSDFTERFFYVNSSGDWVREDANDYKGISPAFRIGNQNQMWENNVKWNNKYFIFFVLLIFK